MDQANKKATKSAYCVTSFFYTKLSASECKQVNNWIKVCQYTDLEMVINIHAYVGRFLHICQADNTSTYRLSLVPSCGRF